MRYYSWFAFIALITLPSIIQAQNNFSPPKEALNLFNFYKPVMARRDNAIVDDPIVLIGDINSDKQEDCIISFFMTSKDGGNAIIGHECAIYLNTGLGMKVVGAFPDFSFCYTLDHIQDQVIYAKEYECQPPYNKIVRESKFVYKGGEIKVIP